MKILNKEQIQAADAYTIKNEPIASTDLMERAATQFFNRLLKIINKDQCIHIFCGKGNNGGDGLVLARLLLQSQFDVQTYIVHYTQKSSQDFDINLDRLKKTSGNRIKDIYEGTDFPLITSEDIIVDALWGTGLTRPIEGFSREIISGINDSNAIVVGLDIPSGSFCDSMNDDEAKVNAQYTFSFQPPKLSFFIPENESYIGSWDFLDIGLMQSFITAQDTPYHYSYESDIRPLLIKRKAFDHKGKFGHALIISGSYGKIGAAVLASRACIRSGAGLVSTYVPKCGYEILQTAVPEAMLFTDEETELITSIPELEMFNAIGIGPGIGTHKRTEYALKRLFDKFKYPMVIDADAVNILSKNPKLLHDIPKQSILTPHIGEFERLTGSSQTHFERLEKLRSFCKKHSLIIVLKGKYSAVCDQEGHVFFNSTGNSGMATGGSGDVLTGIITGLLAQHYTPIHAARLGVYLHGLAGDLALDQLGANALMASDIIELLPKAFKKLS